MSRFVSGWHNTSRSLSAPTVESRSADDLVDVVIRRGTSIKERNGIREYRSGQFARLPATLARMYAVGSLDCGDPSEPERRGWSRRGLQADGRETRVCRYGSMTLALNGALT